MDSRNLENENKIMREMFNDPDPSAKPEPGYLRWMLIGLVVLAAYFGVVQLLYPLFE